MANSFLTIHDEIKDFLKSDKLINSVSYGDVYEEVLQKKHKNYPIAHFIFTNVNVQDQLNTLTVDVMLMDLVDRSNTYNQTEAELHILNEMLAVAERLHKELREGDLASQQILAGDMSAEAFRDDLDDGVAGYSLSFDIQFPNQITACNT
jgi:predicted CopG family antitoxin